MSGQDTRASQDLARRIAQLEQQHRRMKRIGFFALLAIPGTLVLLGQAQPKQHAIEASEIVIKDAAGKIRASLGTKGDNVTSLDFYDQQGDMACSLSSVGALICFDRHGEKGIALSGTELTFENAAGHMVSYLNADGLGLHRVGGHMLAGMRADDKRGGAFVGDAEGFEAVLGVVPLQNLTKGGSETTSAASLVFFDPNKKVIWKAP